jgi:hypothetical protein
MSRKTRDVMARTIHYSLRNKLSHSSIHCIHSSCCLLFLAHLCVLCQYWTLLCVTWRTFHSDTHPLIIQSFWFYKTNITSGFTIGHPRQCWVPLLVSYKCHNFEKKLLNTKCIIWLSLQLLPDSLLILRRIQRDIIKIIQRSSCEIFS